MTRFVEELFLFLLPFAVFAGWLALRRRSPFAKAHWDGSVSWLFLAGLALALGSILLNFAMNPNRVGTYVPAHIEKGQLVPGRVE